MIDETGKSLGVMKREDALALTKPDLGIDLIEIVSTATPPVARLMSFDKYRYERVKQLKKDRLAQKGSGLKHVQISARAAVNDLLIKAKQADKFILEGNQVEINMRLRGREKYNKDWAKMKMEEFLKMITLEYQVIMQPRWGGRGLAVQISKK